MRRTTALALASLLACGGAAFAQTTRPEPEAQEPPPDDAEKPAKKAKRSRPVVFGYVQTHYRHSRDTREDGIVDAPNFRVQRLRLGVKGDVFSWLSYDVEIDPRAPEIGGVLRDAYVAFKFIPDQQLRVGQLKTQFGYENRESSSELYGVNRTELSDTLSRGINLRDIGIGLIGHRDFGRGWRFEDAITLVNGAGFNVQADDTRRKNVWGRVGLRYRSSPGDLTVRLGASGAMGDEMNEGALPLDPEDDFRQDFERLEFLQPGKEATLVSDIAHRTGLEVVRVETQRIDLLRDAAEITIYFRPRDAR